MFARPAGGFAGVANVGLDEYWLGNHLSQANLYGFGRLAWNPDLSAATIIDEWTRATFGNDPRVVETMNGIQLDSWRTFENYTGPLGLQTLTDIVGNHYGVAVEASERNGWGQWHRADDKGVGHGSHHRDRHWIHRTVFARGAPGLRIAATCPDDLLLFMHHVPYTHVLHCGNTVIQSTLRLALRRRRTGRRSTRAAGVRSTVSSTGTLRAVSRQLDLPGRARDCVA